MPSPHQADVPVRAITDEPWFPMDSQEDYELVPLNPYSAKFQRITQNMAGKIGFLAVKDIFKIQNPFLLQKYKL